MNNAHLLVEFVNLGFGVSLTLGHAKYLSNVKVEENLELRSSNSKNHEREKKRNINTTGRN